MWKLYTLSFHFLVFIKVTSALLLLCAVLHQNPRVQ